MDRNELEALRDAIETVLAWPPAVLDQVASWLAPGAVADVRHKAAPHVGHKPNGVDRQPPPTAAKSAKLSNPPTPGRSNDRRLLDTLRDNPGLSANALAKASNVSRTTTSTRVRQLAARGAIEKDPEGGWRLAGEVNPSTDTRGSLPGPTQAPL
jgi:biotin operon repressor